MASRPLRTHASLAQSDTADHPGVAWLVGPADAAIRDEVIRNKDVPVPTFGDAAWSLAAMGGASGRSKTTLYFERTDGMRRKVLVPPVEWADCLRRVAYVLVNNEMPLSWTRRLQTNRVARLDPGTIRPVVAALRDFMAWLASKHVYCLADVTPDLLDVYYADVTANTRVRASRHYVLLSAVERLSHLAPLLPEDDRLCRPNWEADWAYDRRNEAADGAAREVLDPAIADPMLLGAIATVRHMAPDILAAYDHVAQALERPAITNHAAARAILLELANGDGIPGFQNGSRRRLDATGLRYLHGLAEQTFSKQLSSAGLAERVVAPPVLAQAAIHGQVGERPWCAGVPLRDLQAVSGVGAVPRALRHLRTACWIVLAFLSGARPEEVRHLPIDALDVMPPRTPDGPVRCLLNAHKRKRERDADGRASERGRPAQWVTLAAGADAAGVAALVTERTDPDSEWLFPGTGSDEDRKNAIKHATLAKHVSDWVAWYNTLAVENDWGDAYLIPTDRGRTWDLATFRRTAAWHIADQPRGRAALQQQFQHANVMQGGAYSSLAEVGVRRVMSEGRRAAHDQLMADVADAITHGGTHVSGPAAERLVEAARLSEPLRATFQTEREAGRLSDSGQQVFDNPRAYSLCVYDPSLAKCMTTDDLEDDDTSSMPDRGACQSSCACHARTDAEVEVMRADIEQHRREAVSPLTPQPMSVRLNQVADRKQRQVNEHERTAVFIDLRDVARPPVEPLHPQVQA